MNSSDKFYRSERLPEPHHPISISISNSISNSASQVRFLLAGLERQKDELGAIAFELIDLLHRLGVNTSVEASYPQVIRKR